MGNITFINAPANIPLTLSSAQDTINIDAVGQGVTYTLAQPILGGENMLAIAEYWQDSVQIYTFGAEPPVQYSLNGQDWQSEPLFTGLPFQDSVTVWVKDVYDCPITQTSFYTRVKAPLPCIAAENEAQVEQFKTSVDSLFLWNAPLYSLYGCFTDVEQISFVALKHSCLTHLYLGRAYDSLPLQIWNLYSLTTLWLDGNQLSSLPSEIENLTSLKDLHVGDNQLTSLPSEIGNLTELEILWLFGNHLSSLPPEIENLAALKVLVLSLNQFTEFPHKILKLTGLTDISIGQNQLTSLPPEIGNFFTLKNLFLDDNQLVTLPPEIANLADTLEWLDLRGNPIPFQDRAYYQSLLPNTVIFW